MLVAFTSFTVSLIAIVTMISIKASEIKNQKKSFIGKFTLKTDHFFVEISRNIVKALSYINRHTFISLIQWVAYHVLSRARKIYIWAYNKAHEHPHSKKVIDMVRGKGDVSKAGGASFYLKRISDNVYRAEEIKPSFVKK